MITFKQLSEVAGSIKTIRFQNYTTPHTYAEERLVWDADRSLWRDEYDEGFTFTDDQLDLLEVVSVHAKDYGNLQVVVRYPQ
jgi:hypothetical protein